MGFITKKFSRFSPYTLYAGIALAVLLWMVIFFLPAGGFWMKMTLCIAAASGYALCPGKSDLKKILTWKGFFLPLGLLSAGVLYMIFYAGRWLSELVFGFAANQIAAVYAMKVGGNELVLGVLLFLVIAPGEEFFWRGFLQEKMSLFLNSSSVGYIIVSFLYGVVHLWSGNFILCMAALVCGFFWGCLFTKTKSLWPGILSHSVWDVAVFILFPV